MDVNMKERTLEFAIQGLHYDGVGPVNDKSGLIHMTGREYDNLLSENPSAILQYRDEDGDHVQVGSSLELYQRCHEPQFHHRKPTFSIKDDVKAKEAWLATEFPYRNTEENLRYLHRKMTSWSTPTASDQSDQEELIDNNDLLSCVPSSPRSTWTPTSAGDDGGWEEVSPEESNTSREDKWKKKSEGPSTPIEGGLKVLSPRPESPGPQEQIIFGKLSAPSEHVRPVADAWRLEGKITYACPRHKYRHSYARFGRYRQHSRERRNFDKSEATHRHHRGYGYRASSNLLRLSPSAYSRIWECDEKPHRPWESFNSWRSKKHASRLGARRHRSNCGRHAILREELVAGPSFLKSRPSPFSTATGSDEGGQKGFSKTLEVFGDDKESQQQEAGLQSLILEFRTEITRLTDEQNRLKSEISQLALKREQRQGDIAAMPTRPDDTAVQTSPGIPTPDSIIHQTPELLPPPISNLLQSIGYYTNEAKRWLPPVASEHLTTFQNNLHRHIPPIQHPNDGDSVYQAPATGQPGSSTLIGSFGPHLNNLAEILSKGAEQAKELADQSRKADKRAAMMVAEGITTIMAYSNREEETTVAATNSLAQEGDNGTAKLEEEQRTPATKQADGLGNDVSDTGRTQNEKAEEAIDHEMPSPQSPADANEDCSTPDDITNPKLTIFMYRGKCMNQLCFSDAFEVDSKLIRFAFVRLGFNPKGYARYDNGHGSVQFATTGAAAAALAEIKGQKIDNYRVVCRGADSTEDNEAATLQREIRSATPVYVEKWDVCKLIAAESQARPRVARGSRRSRTKNNSHGSKSKAVDNLLTGDPTLVHTGGGLPTTTMTKEELETEKGPARKQRNEIADNLQSTTPSLSNYWDVSDQEQITSTFSTGNAHKLQCETMQRDLTGGSPRMSPAPDVPKKIAVSPAVPDSLPQNDSSNSKPSKSVRHQLPTAIEEVATPREDEKGKAPERPPKIVMPGTLPEGGQQQVRASIPKLSSEKKTSSPKRSRPSSFCAPGQLPGLSGVAAGERVPSMSTAVGRPSASRSQVMTWAPMPSMRQQCQPTLQRLQPQTDDLPWELDQQRTDASFPRSNPSKHFTVDVNSLGSPMRRSNTDAVRSPAPASSLQPCHPPLIPGHSPRGAARRVQPPPPPPPSRRQSTAQKASQDYDRTHLYYSLGKGNLAVGECVHQLIRMGYEEDTVHGFTSLQRYAEIANGDVATAIDLIEEVRRKREQHER